jgi:hypothetical protein
MAMTPQHGWSWSAAAQAFLTANVQVRKYRNFSQVESQNWFTLASERSWSRFRLAFHAMGSLEPFTLRRLGSAQVFQTGETLDGAPLIDYQHPHDLFSGLETRAEWSFGPATRIFAQVAPVGEAALGPTAFVHRPSAQRNPTAPLTHHNLDSTHVSRSVVTMGATRGTLTWEASTFKGREPDEHRLNLDLGVPDSWSARVSWRQGSWSAQASAAKLKVPDVTEPYDMRRLTASLSYSGRWRGRPLAVTAASGRNVEFYGNADGYLIEAASQLTPKYGVYVRGERAAKDILTAGGFDPPGFTQGHVFSTVGALTFGAERTLARTKAGEAGLGADVTGYLVPSNLDDNYGRPWSLHVFICYRTR